MKNFALIAAFLVANAASAQPPGPAPTFSLVRKTVHEKGHAILVRTQTIAEYVPFTEKMLINGKLIDVTSYKMVYKQVAVDITYDLGTARVITPDGKQLPIDEVWKRLKPDTIVAISGNFST